MGAKFVIVWFHIEKRRTETTMEGTIVYRKWRGIGHNCDPNIEYVLYEIGNN